MRATLADVKTAKPPRTVYIAFEGHQVAVRSDAPEVLAGFESIYSAMVVAAATRAVGHLEVSGNGGMYYVRGDTVALDEGSLADVLRWLGVNPGEMHLQLAEDPLGSVPHRWLPRGGPFVPRCAMRDSACR